MMDVRCYRHPLARAHDPGAGHPERPARLDAIFAGLEAAALGDRFAFAEPEPADRDDLLRVHTAAHVDRVLGGRGTPTAFDPDTRTSADSVDAALLAAGAATAAVDDALADPDTAPFVAMRPPGHHAEADRAMGFCLFNNVAVAAAHAIDHHGLERVLVFDPDVHHGNGTQHIFEADPRVFYCSIHQYPFYPGTGAANEIGVGAGAGYTANVPLPGGLGDAEYAHAAALAAELLTEYDPELVLFSAGFDAHARDPLGGMNLTSAGFLGAFGPLVRAARGAGTPMAFMLEGGYDLTALAETVPMLCRALIDESFPEPAAGTPPPPVADVIGDVRRRLAAAR